MAKVVNKDLNNYEPESFTVGDVITIDGDTLRIIAIREGIATGVVMNSSKLTFINKKVVDIFDMLQSGEAIKETKPVQTKYISIEDMNDSMKEAYDKKVKMMAEVVEHFSTNFGAIKTNEGSKWCADLYKRYGIPKTTFWRLLKKYLQSGMDNNSLIDMRLDRQLPNGNNYKSKPGRPSKSDKVSSDVVITNEEKKIFEKYKKFYLEGRYRSIHKAYEKMILDNYLIVVEKNGTATRKPAPIKNRPTENQFRYYVQINTTKKQRDIAKTSKRENRNNERALIADNLVGVTGPCSLVEMDECEVDVFLVSSYNPSIEVGRPIVYIMIDVYTRMIIAYSVSFENNSGVGFTNCLLNLLTDKSEICKKYGLSPNIFWPSGILPQRLRTDYGSEYISYAVEKICNEHGIQAELATPATGSFKGQVEQLFHQIHSSNNMIFEKNGLIEKRYDSTHKKSAVLNIEEFESILVGNIVAHNIKQMPNYPKTRDMRRKNLNPVTPTTLWEYGVKKYGEPRHIENAEAFKYSLLKPIEATIGRSGIYYKGLNYVSQDSDGWLKEKMNNAFSTVQRVEARIDPRDVGRIYLLDNDKQIRSYSLNALRQGMSEYEDVYLEEYLAIHEQDAIENIEGKAYNTEVEIAELARTKSIVDTASGQGYTHSSKNLRENRRLEKQAINEKQQIFKEDTPLIETNPKQTDTTKDPHALVEKVSKKEALRRFRNDTRIK